jgi:hypothetical protein
MRLTHRRSYINTMAAKFNPATQHVLLAIKYYTKKANRIDGRSKK